MKSILISIQPKWVEKITNGEKTIEIRKSRPKIKTPFKCYIYETQGEYKTETGIFAYGIELKGTKKGKGKVIGEFVCDEIEYISPNYGYLDARCIDGAGYILDKCCLTAKDLIEYGKGKPLYGWHISNLKIYDKPKDLKEFYSAKCDMPCEHKKRGFNMDFCMAYENGSHFCKKLACDKKRLSRPPQSWCYIEE